jgi:hypothetical protein
MVERSPRYPNVVGLSPTSAAAMKFTGILNIQLETLTNFTVTNAEHALALIYFLTVFRCIDKVCVKLATNLPAKAMK